MEQINQFGVGFRLQAHKSLTPEKDPGSQPLPVINLTGKTKIVTHLAKTKRAKKARFVGADRAALKPQKKETSLAARFCGRGGTRTPDIYCVILKSHLPLLPICPFRVLLFGFLRFLGAKCPLRPIFPLCFFLIATPRRL